MPDDVHRQGKTIAEIKEGDSLTVTESISERDLLIYLGLTNDNNPLYIQNEYAQKLGYAGPVVPPVLLSGIITSSVSKLLPGPGSEVVNFSANFIRPVYHDEIVTFSFEVIKVDTMKEVVMISVEGSNRQNERVLDSVVMARPPRQQD
ncbi:MaoC/PaaZ C-terminal domain-containing protein [Ligilactobacillus animalis]|uniref:MaoC/PaaZ C-terminal domain-containing protein n=1 Tax=Ligilactobacillus animalis TaxID=1605 RepID=UPI0002195571|nr:MaoC/PaaZ C-terminal domain-containing protein [Ligilactobacillus animalis]KRM58991.1 dehydrogenase [Ligilactobacillus animalis KCTC 3501 = DSM 20602]MBU5279744.1 MaoC family dehydratase N-terminal domain-containing protein [Ligilactobacillus animalis]WKB75048.1 MaoC/PaaZ C-terminal domain-containing protein [Ligilactobacillus animalis]